MRIGSGRLFDCCFPSRNRLSVIARQLQQRTEVQTRLKKIRRQRNRAAIGIGTFVPLANGSQQDAQVEPGRMDHRAQARRRPSPVSGNGFFKLTLALQLFRLANQTSEILDACHNLSLRPDGREPEYICASGWHVDLELNDCTYKHCNLLG